MKRIFLFLSIVLCSLSMTAQSAWLFNRGDSISWQPTQDMTITYEKDPAGFFWQNIQTGTLDIVRMPIYTNDGITFADTPFLQVEKNNIEVTNEGDRRFEVRLKTNISDWNTITCQPQADWLRLVGTDGSQFPVITYTFEYDANYTGADREALVAFKNEQYNLSDTVWIASISESDFIRASKREYHIINQGIRYLNIHVDSNLEWNETGGYAYQVIDCEGNWLKAQDSSIEYENNWTGRDREARLIIRAVNNSQLADTVKVIQHAATLANTSQYKTLTISPNGGILEVPILGGSSLEVKLASYDFFNGYEKDLPHYMHRIEDAIQGDNRLVRFEIDANNSEDARYCADAFYIQVGDGPEERFRFVQLGKNAPTFEEQKKALEALYTSTNGNNWKDNTNWLSDNPVNQWYGVNNDIWGNDTIVGDYILRIQLIDNQLIGTIPEELTALMLAPDIDDQLTKTVSLDIELNGLYGTIPASVKQSPRWSELGWGIICQNPYLNNGKLFDVNDFNLKSANNEVFLFVEDQKTNLYDLLEQNEYTLVLDSGIDDDFVNLYLDYCNKGLGVITEHRIFEGETWDEHIRQAKELQAKGFPSGIKWINKVSKSNWYSSQIGEKYLLDKEGNLVQYWGNDFSIPTSWYLEQVRNVIKPLLGDPEEHEPYGDVYTSTDFSRDGEVMTLQTATSGKGIDIVLMGDAYVDEDIASGKYEQNMRQGMEQFFSDEVYAALRNRFNVYAVTVVSPNRTTSNGGQWKLNYDDNICLEYAYRIPNVDIDNVTIINIVNNDNPNGMKGHASMYTGLGVAHIEEGGPTELIIHEAGGHAFAKLADEYILGGYGGNSCPEEELDNFNQWIAESHAQGMYANVSATNDPAQVPWAHMLTDERYKDDVGMYEGAWMWPHDLWRPSENSVMNTDNYRFNAPSREAIYKRVMRLSEGDSWTYDYEKFVEFDAPVREAYRQQQNAARRTKGQNVQKRRIESRPPTIYKGTWRDAGKCEKVEYTTTK